MSDATAALSSLGTLSTFANHSVTKKAPALPRYWSRDEEDELVKLREYEGLSSRDIASLLDRTPGSITAKIERMGLQLPVGLKRSRSRTLPAAKESILRRHWMNGVAIEVAAELVGTSEGTAARYYHEFAEAERGSLNDGRFGTYIGHKEMMVIAGKVCGVPPSAIAGATRMKPNVCARMAIARALRDKGVSMVQIARRLGRSDHSTVHHYLRVFDKYGKVYPETRRAYEAIKDAEARAAERLAA
jgi:transposase